MVTLATPVACVELDMWVVCPWVVKGGVAGIDFISTHEVSGRVLKDHLWGDLVVGVGVGEGGCAVAVAFLELEEFLSHFCDTVGRVADVGMEGMEGVILFQVDSVVDQL